MSGWDASMPSREPERHRSGGAPRHAPGAPPDVFEPAYGPFEPDYRPFEADYDPQADAQQPSGREPQPDYGREDFAPRRRAENGGYDGDASGLGSNGRHGRPGGGREDYPGQDYARGDYGQRYGREDHAQAGHARRDYPGGDTVDPDYAARMDPALQDFFAPQPSRSDFAPPTRQPGRLSGPQPGLQPGPQQGRLIRVGQQGRGPVGEQVRHGVHTGHEQERQRLQQFVPAERGVVGALACHGGVVRGDQRAGQVVLRGGAAAGHQVTEVVAQFECGVDGSVAEAAARAATRRPSTRPWPRCWRRPGPART